MTRYSQATVTLLSWASITRRCPHWTALYSIWDKSSLCSVKVMRLLPANVSAADVSAADVSAANVSAADVSTPLRYHRCWILDLCLL